MNLDHLKLTLTQIGILVKQLNKKNFAETSENINQIIDEFGLEADRHCLRCLFSIINFADATSLTTQVQANFLGVQLEKQLTRAPVISNICFAIDNCFPTQKTLKPTAQLIPQIVKLTGINKLCESVLSLALTHSSQSDLRKFANENLKKAFPELIESYLGKSKATAALVSSLYDVSLDLLQLLLVSLDEYVPTELVWQFLKKLQEEFPLERVPLILAPFLYRVSATNCVDELNINQINGEGEVLTEIGIEEIYDNLCETFLTTQGNCIMDTSWINLILEIGYEFTSSVDECKNHLRCGSRDLQPQDVAKIIGLMCRRQSSILDCNVNLPTPANFWPGQPAQQQQNVANNNDGSSISSLDKSTNSSDKKDKSASSSGSSISTNETTQAWKPDVFVQALKEVVPQLSWKDVFLGLDHQEFVLKDRIGLDLLLTIFRLGTQTAVFPYPDCIYRHWQNVEAQFSLVAVMLKNPDIFSFADYIFSSSPVELLKTAPDIENKEICTWKSLHLIDVLLYVADQGYYSQVHEIFKFPMQQCPDVLFLSLLHLSPPLTALRQELFNQLIPTFLTNHPNSSVILASAWNSVNFGHSIRSVIMHAMSEWYLRGTEYDQVKLSRILDVAQDLKALSTLLNARSFLFVIDLACLASRREYLKLEKWLGDKIREHGEAFIQSMIKCLQRRCPQIANAKIPNDQLPPKPAQLPPETISTMLSCLQSCIGSVPPEVAEIIMQMSTNCSIIANKARAAQQQGPQGPQGLVPLQGVMRGLRGMEMGGGVPGVPPPSFSGNINAQTGFGPTMDAISNLSTNVGNLNLNGPNGAFNFGNALGNLVSTPASPSRLMNPTPIPYSMMQVQGGPPNVNSLNRMPPAAPQPTPPNPNNPVMGDLQTPVSKEVEDEANSYFQRIYNHPPHPTLTIDEVLDILQRFKESNNRREQEVYLCMLRNLFEEYRFFPHYPDKELQITAQLFGGIIERNLVPTFVAMGLALRCVLDALRKPEGSKMYYFGITALDRFKTRLHTYDKYCEFIRSIPHFQEFPPHLIHYVECGFLSQEPNPAKLQMLMAAAAANNSAPQQPTSESVYRSNSVTGNVVTTPTQQKMVVAQSIHASRVKSIATATNIDTLLVANQEEKITVPPEAVQDKTAFIFNNLSQLNIPQKCEEIKEIMTKDYWPWLAQYLVLKRASMEFNFHHLYYNFLEALKNADINKFVTKETLRNIKVLLRCDKGMGNFSDRSLLKNLGHWLGMITIGRNRPILQLDLDLKSLLAEAYHKGQPELLFVVPFVAKILESTHKSKVFKSPNPWTMGIMNVLGELHQEPELKLNLKFEIEVLCKTLGLDLTKLKPIIYLKDPSRSINIEHQMSQPKPKIIDSAPSTQQQQTQQLQHAPPQQPQPQITNEVDAQAMLISAANNVPGGAIPSPSIANETTGQVMIPAPEPRYSYLEINVANFQMVAPHIVMSPNITFLHANPAFKHILLNAIERTITEWMQPVVDRSVRIAASTTEHIVRKDFALDADENRMRIAAHQMVRNLAAGMVMITCKDQLLQSLNSNVRKAFLATVSGSPSYQEIESASLQLASDNVEIACAFIQKTAAEKSTPEIDRRLAPDFETRKIAREEGSRFFDPQTLAYQTERMPEHIRLKVGGVPPAQFAVYTEFARNIPGFQLLSDRDVALYLPKPQDMPPAFATDELGLIYAELASKMETFLNSTVNISSLQLQASKMHTLLNSLMVTRRIRDNDSALVLLTRTVEGLIEGLINVPEHVEQMKLYRDIHLRILSILQNTFGVPSTERAITKCLFDIREDVRYNVDAVKLLLTSHFVNVSQFDALLRETMDNGNNYLAVSFAMTLMERLLVDERSSPMVAETEFITTIEMLARLSQHRHRYPEALTHLIDMLWGGSSNAEPGQFLASDRFLSGATQYIHSGMQHVRSNDCEDPPGLQEKTEFLLKDWVSIYSQSNTVTRETKNFGSFVQKMNMYGILKTDDLITRFFRQATQFCIDLVYRILSDQTHNPAQVKAKIFHWIDAFVHLIALLVRHSGEAGNPTTKINLLNKVLGIVLGILLKDQDIRGNTFSQLGYHRFFLMLFLELSVPDTVLESLMHSIVTAFSHTYHLLNPVSAPGFCYSWIELISHRTFIGRILAQIAQQKGWPLYAQLLMDLFNFLAPFLRNAELAKPVQIMYKGTLRVLLVLLHDFPEFLCDYHFGFCDVIPPNCIQMRNIILAAFPRNMRLPDPFTPNLKVDMLNETATAPKICSNYVTNIQPGNFKKDLDSYLKARAPVTFLSELRSHLQISNEPGSRYNIPLMNALVLYVGTQAIAHIRSKNCVPSTSNIAHSAHMDIFQNLAVDLDTEGRYLFLNAIANQLRYPNSHTHYFSCAVLHLFAEANTEVIQEQITRVLLERLIVNRPHPWGLLITFIELIKNPIYKFWDHDFVHCAPEIAKLFESVARSCMVKSSHQQQTGNSDGDNSESIS
ncbi:CCR4-NOT transcription complex subunit 1 isoform X3 [Teleopsis dalmanni]|uniref:CCR4-NOT transcription complex subunit 1 isoform X3 n=1 Tax=Teleopsis dalmanni TaxID=139649 RepID=UPI0018CCB03D|nr:CCR4-NOT transcription complex subunit 1 isoform X3 [Teleopsis dalmanni]